MQKIHNNKFIIKVKVTILRFNDTKSKEIENFKIYILSFWVMSVNLGRNGFIKLTPDRHPQHRPHSRGSFGGSENRR
jgi:hypothetical protein